MGLGISGGGINDPLRNHFQERIDYGVMNSCLVKPALYLVQVNMIINMIIVIMMILSDFFLQRTSPRVRLAEVMAEPKKENESPKGEK